MRFGRNFGNRWKDVFRREVDPAIAAFDLPPKWRWKIARNALPFVLMFAIARHYNQVAMSWFSLFFGFIITTWQIVAYGYFRKSLPIAFMHVSTFYGKRYLILLAIFWIILIAGIALRLYWMAP